MKGLEHLNVVVQRGTNVSIPLVIPSYELPVLQAIHDTNSESPMIFVRGEPFICDVDDFDADQALDALKRKYQDNRDAIDRVYKSSRELEQAVTLVEVKKVKKINDHETA